MAPGRCLAVDIGGTKCAAGLVDYQGVLSGATKIATPSSHDPEIVWTAVADMVRGVLEESGDSVEVCGVGCGGPMSMGGEEVSPLNIPAWRGFPLRSRLAELTGLTTFVDNDAKALAIAEGWVGAAEGQTDYVAIVVSTGVGGGIVLDGRLLDGQHGNAGHIGHITVEPDGHLCACGARGCLEAEASGTAIQAITGRSPAEASPETVERVGTYVGRAVATMAVLLDLSLAVVAGSVALGFGEPFFTAAQEELTKRAMIEYVLGAEIRPAGLGPEGPLIGAGTVGLKGRSEVATR